MANEWSWVAVAEVCDVFLGGTPRRADPSYWSGPVKWASAKDIVGCSSRYIIHTEETITHKGIEESAAKLLGKDTVVITARGTVGALCMLGEPMSFNQTCYGLFGNKAIITQHYLYYALKEALSQVHSLSYGTIFDTITMKTFESIQIPLPSLAEQHRIVHILGTLDDRIDLNRRMNRTLEKIVGAIFKNWFVDFDPVLTKTVGHDPGLPSEITALFPDNFQDSEMGEIPKGWRQGALGDIADNARRSVKPDEVSPMTPYIGLQHMPRRCITLDTWGLADEVGSQKSRFNEGEILFGKLRPYFHKVGIAPFAGVCSTDILVVIPKAEYWHSYVLSLVSSKAFVDYTDSHSAGTKMPRTNWKDMSRYPLALPPAELASAFQNHVAALHQRIAVSVRQNRRLARLRDTLLPQLLSGELEVMDAEELMGGIA